MSCKQQIPTNRSYKEEIFYFSQAIIKELRRYKLYIFLILFGFAMPSLMAQQAPTFTHHKDAMMYFNPAYAGMREGICVNGLMRQQWAGFKNADGDNVSPQTYLISVDSPIKLFHGGVGGNIIQDQKNDIWSDIEVQLAYSFHARLSFADLGIGAGLNIVNKSINGSKWDATDDVGTDPLLAASDESGMQVDGNFGLFLTSPGQYYFGFSVTNLFESTFKNITGEIGNARAYHINGGYFFPLPSSPMFDIEVMALVQTDLKAAQYNLSGIVTYNDRFWAGLNFRSNIVNRESIGAMIGLRFKDFRIGYAYDINIMGIGVPGGHEISVGYCFKIKGDRSNTSYKNTRYL